VNSGDLQWVANNDELREKVFEKRKVLFIKIKIKKIIYANYRFFFGQPKVCLVRPKFW
jgi:hypothetical protein